MCEGRKERETARQNESRVSRESPSLAIEILEIAIAHMTCLEHRREDQIMKGWRADGGG